jgi:hypothetical protein
MTDMMIPPYKFLKSALITEKAKGHYKMQTTINFRTYCSLGSDDLLNALHYLIGFDRLLLCDDVSELEINIQFRLKKSVAHLAELFETFHNNLPPKPLLKYFKTTKKLAVTYASQVDGANYDTYAKQNPTLINIYPPDIKASIEAYQQAVANAGVIERHHEFALLFAEILDLFEEQKATIKKKYGLDCQPILDERTRSLQKVPKDLDALSALIVEAQAARAARPNQIVEMPVYHASPLPNTFPVNSYPGGSEYIGTTKSGDQFWAQVVANFSPASGEVSEDWQSRKAWYAVLHTFARDGTHLATVGERIGTTSQGEAQILQKAKQRMDELIAEQGPIKFGRIAIRLFQASINDCMFGLVDTSTEEWGDSVTMQPADLVFYPPWTGDYDT